MTDKGHMQAAATEEYFTISEDPHELVDFLDEVKEKHSEIERTLLTLETSPDDADALHEVFRALHTIKGDARVYQIVPMVDFCHAVENVIDKVRKGDFHFSSSISEIILMCVDRLLIMTRDLATTQRTKLDSLAEVADLINKMTSSDAKEVPMYTKKIACALSGAFCDTEVEEVKIEGGIIDHEALEFPPDLDDDLAFFQTLAREVDERHNHWANRTQFLMPIVLGMNGLAGNPVDFFQLEAAVYLHDIGMGFVPDDVMNGNKLRSEQRRKLDNHPVVAYNLVKRMPNWGPAALMVLQHHEHVDGTGYPNRLSGDDIENGARIIAIADAFYSMTHERPDRNTRRSLMRAVAEINACVNTQFCPFWVEIFNTTVKIQRMAGAL